LIGVVKLVSTYFRNTDSSFFYFAKLVDEYEVVQ